GRPIEGRRVVKPSSTVLGTFAAAAVASLAGCASGSLPLPLAESPPPVPTSSSVFAGHARAFRFVNEGWVAAPEDDYDFLVLEKRYSDHRDVVKEIYRRHPKYGGRSGPRVQTLWFSIRMSPAADGGFDLVATTSEGNGTGHETAGEGGLSLEIAYARTNWFVPFDTIRIRQDRSTSPGRRMETVTLIKKGKGTETPFMKMEEDGLVYKPVRP
ncbi:MAG TPA: hypothetical protein VLH41_08985, partial [Thermoanaerobaculia bacterium]|nr:hypothetical protein [Thermoanaerobaculia bacterium]